MAKTARDVVGLVPRIEILLPEKIPKNKRAALLAIYAKSKAAVVLLRNIDHCRAYEARAAGLERYARTLHDGQMTVTARRVMCWAIRRCGELLKEEPSGTGAHLKRVTSVPLSKGRKALAVLHSLTERERKRAIRFAAIPIKLFTEVVEDDVQIPTLLAIEQLGKNELGRQARAAKGKVLEDGHEDGEITKRYDLIYADPPWRYEHPPMGSSSRSIENQYPTMDLEEICSLSVGSNQVPIHALAADNAILFLWATSPKLAECMQVLTSWGFVYRAEIIWDKEIIGMGYLVRNKHETLLIAKRGELGAPATKNRPPSIISSRRGKHSVKPEIFRKWLVRMYPDLERIELFARQQHKGWDVWGYEATEAGNGGEQEADQRRARA